ncbi:hypothetical protein BJ085DRAFT_31049 [Dimargaris cristalligena]|uniref:MAPEG family protein n=1 Tax=Dimargaris cristalligena TaxID=215637 RepID=A0A4P9ZUP3_9FUNG|nr:hypothetical protein BJ085DRAFT_31049 [Dimargaris cristalligena]|eukprot:RKP37294.1 hypothetical protein BJ085DRAFT_31049 [Dimargaris cristalligena]
MALIFGLGPMLAISLGINALIQNFNLMAPLIGLFGLIAEPERISLAALVFTAFWSYKITSVLASVTIGLNSDNNAVEMAQPRVQRASLTGIAGRAYAAHLNNLETIPIYAAAVLAAYITDVPLQLRNTMAVTYLVARVIHTVVYLANMTQARTLSYLVSTSACLILLSFAAFRNFGSFYDSVLSILGGARYPTAQNHITDAAHKAAASIIAAVKNEL